jgi:hypothetical protein
MVVLCFSSLTQSGKAAPRQRAANPGEVFRDDPCTHLPDPPGQAKGIDKQCPAGGSSSGIAKGDFNGDGFADLAIGEPGATINGQTSAGDVIIVYGSANGLTTTGRQLWDLSGIPACPQAPICVGVDYAGVNPQSEAGDRFGSALASGDFNGDGFTDLAIGIPGKTVTQNPLGIIPITHKNSGAVIILYGSQKGLTITDPTVPAPTLFDLNTAPSSYLNNFGWDGAQFGASLAWGNFNGDKDSINGNPIGDLAIGVPSAPAQVLGFTVFANEGAVIVFPGGSHGLTAVGGISIDEFDLFVADSSNNFFGAALTSGDFNGDGFSDLAIGAPGFPSATASNVGEVNVIYGSTNGLDPFGTPSPQVWAQSDFGATAAGGDRFGAALASGDFNGDGKSDLALGSPGKAVGSAGAGVVFVLFGKANSGLTSTGNQRWDQNILGRGVQTNAGFGTALAAGDFNGDGSADLAVGVPFRTISGLANAGEVDVIYGSKATSTITGGLSTSAVRAPQIWTQGGIPFANGIQAGNRFGDSLTAWNFGRNESTVFGTCPICLVLPTPTADLAIGAPFERVDGVSGAGAVDVIYGSFSSNGLVFTNPSILNADTTNIGGPLPGAHFGVALY